MAAARVVHQRQPGRTPGTTIYRAAPGLFPRCEYSGWRPSAAPSRNPARPEPRPAWPTVRC